MTPEFNRWWNADELMQKNPYRKDTPIWWAWEGWQARQWAEMLTEKGLDKRPEGK